MTKVKDVFLESLIIGTFIRFFHSFIYALKNSYILRNIIRIIRAIINAVTVSKTFKTLRPAGIAGLWYKSYFYRSLTFRIRKISFLIPRTHMNFYRVFIGFFLMFTLLMPQRLWSDVIWIPLFLALALIFASRIIRERRGTVFILVNVTILLFMVLVEIALPYTAVKTLIYLLLSIDFFFLVSFSIGRFEDLKSVLCLLFCGSVTICAYAFIQNTLTGYSSNATFIDNNTLGVILVMVFPFSVVYTTMLETKLKKNLYMAFTFIIFLNAISGTQSRAAFIGFFVEVIILILAFPKYLPFTIILMPLGLNNVIENFMMMINQSKHGNFLTDTIYFANNFWRNGFGIKREMIMDIYNSTKIDTINNALIPHLKISPIYIDTLLNLGAIVMIFFLFYIVSLAHSSLTLLFTGDKKYKTFFAAGLSMLIGISVASFFDGDFSSSRVLIIYWGMLGILRAVRIMNYGIYES